MRLGTETANFISAIMTAPGFHIEPTVGMGATITVWTDRHAGTVTKWDGKTLTVQLDKATRTDQNGMSDAQKYAYERNPDGLEYQFRRNKKGQWRPLEQSITGRMVMAKTGHGLILGRRMAFHDYTF